MKSPPTLTKAGWSNPQCTNCWTGIQRGTYHKPSRDEAGGGICTVFYALVEAPCLTVEPNPLMPADAPSTIPVAMLPLAQYRCCKTCDCRAGYLCPVDGRYLTTAKPHLRLRLRSIAGVERWHVDYVSAPGRRVRRETYESLRASDALASARTVWWPADSRRW